MTLQQPTPDQIRAARLAAGHTQAQAAEVIHSARRMTWADYEEGRRVIPLAAWELYLLRTGQHPDWGLVDRPRR